MVDVTEGERLAVEYAATRNGGGTRNPRHSRTTSIREGGEDSGRIVALRAEVVDAWQWLAVVIARQMQRRREPLDDLIQVANVGLLEALDRYDPTRGVTFRRWAETTIQGGIRHHYRAAWHLHVARPVQELNLRIAGAVETLTAELHRTPTVADIAAHTSASVDEVLEALDAGANFWPLSLTAKMASAAELARTDDNLDTIDERLDVEALLARLPPAKRRLLGLRYIDGRTRTEVAALLGISQLDVHFAERAALAHLRSYGHDR